MDVTPRISADAKIIQSYSDKGFRVSGQVYNQAILVKPDEVSLVELEDFNALDPSVLKRLKDVEVLIIGTGEEQKFLPKDVKEQFQSKNISTETMTTGAACRTYNVLMTEGRPIGALLFLR